MHVLDTKDRTKLRKVVLSKFSFTQCPSYYSFVVSLEIW